MKTVTEAGWRTSKDRQLLELAQRDFDVFLTIDGSLEKQHHLPRYKLGFVLVRVPSNQITSYYPVFEDIRNAVNATRAGQIVRVVHPSLI